jgi:hypothetical protein
MSPNFDIGVCIGFLNDLFYGRSYIAAPAELSIPFLLGEKSAVVPVRLAGEQSGGKRKVSYGDAREITVTAPEAPQRAQIIDLMQALKQSIEKAKPVQKAAPAQRTRKTASSDS